jgi:hypothetical protein
VRGGEPPSIVEIVDDIEDEVVEIFSSNCPSRVVGIFFFELSEQPDNSPV